MNLAQQLFNVRQSLGLTPQQLAAKADAAEEDVWRSEDGDGSLEFQKLDKLVSALGHRMILVPDRVQQIKDEICEGTGLQVTPNRAEPQGISEHLERVHGGIFLKDTQLRLRHVLEKLAGDLSGQEIAAAAGVPRELIQAALQELAAMVDHVLV